MYLRDTNQVSLFSAAFFQQLLLPYLRLCGVFSIATLHAALETETAVAVAIEIDAEFALATREEVAQLRRVAARYSTHTHTDTHRGIC